MEQNTNQEPIIELRPTKPLGAFHYMYIFFLLACAYFNTNLSMTYFSFFRANGLESSFKSKISFFVCLAVSVFFIFFTLFNLLLLVKKRRFFLTLNTLFLVSGSVKIAFIDGFLYSYGIYHSYVGEARNLEENYLENKVLGTLFIFAITLVAGLLIIEYYKKRQQHFSETPTKETYDRATSISSKKKTVFISLWAILTLYLLSMVITTAQELRNTKEELELFHSKATRLQSQVSRLTEENQLLKSTLTNTFNEIIKLYDYTYIDDNKFLKQHDEFMKTLFDYIDSYNDSANPQN